MYVLIMMSGKLTFLNKINELTSPETPFLEGSLKMLAERFGMAVSTLKEVLKRSSKLIKHTIGRGRGAVTKLASRSMMFKSLLLSRKKYLEQAQLTFTELLPEAKQFPETLTFPSLAERITYV